MKKVKLITIGLLSLTIASCNSNPEPKNQDWNTPQSYVSSDSGQHYSQTSSGVPIWFYIYMMNNNGRYVYTPSVAYHSHIYVGGHSCGGWKVSSVGHTSTIHSSSHSSSGHMNISRGGFGHSAHSSSSC